MHPKRTIVTEVERQILDKGEGYMHCSLQQGKAWQNSTRTSTLENVLGTTKTRSSALVFFPSFQLMEAGSFCVTMISNSSKGVGTLGSSYMQSYEMLSSLFLLLFLPM